MLKYKSNANSIYTDHLSDRLNDVKECLIKSKVHDPEIMRSMIETKRYNR